MTVHCLPSFVECGCTLGTNRCLSVARQISSHACLYQGFANYCLVATGQEISGRHESVRAYVAQAKDQLDEAGRLVSERYAWRGYLTRSASACPSAKHPSAVTLIARAGGATVGTMTVGLDGPGGLSVDESYGEQVSAARSQGRRVCELTRLALAKQANTKTVLSSLFALAYGIASALHDVTDVFIEVNPRHVGFYRRVFGFATAAGERMCQRVHAPAVLLYASVDELEARLNRYCNPEARAVHQFAGA